jgi:7-cyano-7-deazaguanine synthase
MISTLPESNGAIVILSGGMDSTIAARLCVEKYGKTNVVALTFDYNQKQRIEIQKAKEVCEILDIRHYVCDLKFLGDISIGFSANVDIEIEMPNIKEVLGDPRPKTYVPNRNMILMSISAAYAEVANVNTIVMGLQIHDEYGYHDKSQIFIDKINSVLNENRIIKISVCAPFSSMSKFDEIKILKELDNDVSLLAHTITCYNPDSEGKSCGKCPSCSERISNFMKAGEVDLIPYQVEIPWR